MAFYAQAYSENTGNITAGVYVCRLVIPVAHLLTAAWVYTQEVVTTGTLEVRLRKADVRDPRGGAAIAELIDNDDVTTQADENVRFDFVLLDHAKELAPAERMYFLSLTGSDSADRCNEPLLIVQYDRP